MINNKGYALVTVLLTVVLIVTISSILMGSVLSSRKLVNISEEEMQAKDLAEMGVIHVETALKEISQGEDKDNLVQQIEDIKDQFFKSIDEKHSYQVTLEQEPNPEDEIIYSLSSTGISNGHKHTIGGTINLRKKPNKIENFPSPPKISEPYETVDKLELSKNNPKNYDSLKVLGNITSGTHARLNIKKDLFVLGTLQLKNKGEITIEADGQLYVNNLVLEQNTKLFVNKGNLFAKNVTLYQNSKLEILEGNFIAENDVKLYNKADFYVNGKAYFNKLIDINQNPIICITGNTFLSKQDGDNSLGKYNVPGNTCQKNQNDNNQENNSEWILNLKIDYYQEKRD